MLVLTATDAPNKCICSRYALHLKGMFVNESYATLAQCCCTSKIKVMSRLHCSYESILSSSLP